MTVTWPWPWLAAYFKAWYCHYLEHLSDIVVLRYLHKSGPWLGHRCNYQQHFYYVMLTKFTHTHTHTHFLDQFFGNLLHPQLHTQMILGEMGVQINLDTFVHLQQTIISFRANTNEIILMFQQCFYYIY